MEARTHNGVKTVSSINVFERTELVHAKKVKLDHHLIPYTRINSKWLKDLNISQNIIKILEENTGSKVLDILCSNIFADISPRARKVK